MEAGLAPIRELTEQSCTILSAKRTRYVDVPTQYSKKLYDRRDSNGK